MAREFGEDLAIILVESQGTPDDEAEKFAWDHKWMGTDAMWTSERPFDTGAGGLPNFALLSATGEVLLMGNPNSMHGKIKDAIEAEIENAKSAPEGTPKELVKAWKAFAKGDYAKALAEARKVEAKGGEAGEYAGTTITKFIERVNGKFARVDWMLENGYTMKAVNLSKTLAKGTKGLADFSEKNTGLGEMFAGEDFKSEMTAAKAFAKLEEKLGEEGFDEKLVKKLAKFASKHSETKTGARAQQLLKLAQ